MMRFTARRPFSGTKPDERENFEEMRNEIVIQTTTLSSEIHVP